MDDVQADLIRRANDTRYVPGGGGGHYESFFVRANHPEKPLAFWIRYTIFSPADDPEEALGEVWAIVFDGERDRHVAVKSEFPFSECAFEAGQLGARVGESTLSAGALRGAAESAGHAITWDLSCSGHDTPLFLLDPKLYDAKLPKAKSLVALPMARLVGALTVDGESMEVDDWVGSQNHNWGSKHTDEYAWGQVAGFDDAPESFLEVATARLKFGPIWTPRMTMLVLRHEGKEIALNRLGQALRAKGRFDYFEWDFVSEDAQYRVRGHIEAPKEAFVGLRYYNPPGGTKTCLNSKIASCRLKLTDKTRGSVTELSTAHRAAFEILTDDTSHGVEIRA